MAAGTAQPTTRPGHGDITITSPVDGSLSAMDEAHCSLEGSVGPDVLTRWYIDTRPLAARASSGHELPLLETLRPSDQKAVKAFYHSCDRQMSLASYLLKYLFIHRSCRVPWSEIVIQRSPPPHKRPYYDATALFDGPVGTTHRSRSDRNWEEPIKVEFNVSHQGYLTALAGCQIPKNVPLPPLNGLASPVGGSMSPLPQVGIDITCTNDPTRRRTGTNDNGHPKSEKELRYFIDMFAEVFSTREIDDMKNRGTADGPTQSMLKSPLAKFTSMEYRLRLFYTYWALKEAYIKMTGEALLAPWLQNLEFVNVEVPEPASPPVKNNSGPASCSPSSKEAFGAPETTTQAHLSGATIDNVRLETIGFETDYIFATSARGGGFGANSLEQASAKRWDEFCMVDIEKDVAPCANGTCSCLI
ncbi:hypothetical protein KEM56_003709 [Ascosphaera pollenicola]|nr:hypothetical protein KEM56_003709 [Ascosphaera pollenicola]